MQYMEEHQDELDDGVDEKKLEYLSKALELEPDNLDAARMLAEVNAKNPEDLLEALSSLIEKGNSSMEKEGYFQDCMGDFWGVLETRPYMRLRHSYLELLRLCEGDNLGIRYALMHLYAYFENEDGALALHKKYDEYEESQMLFPLAVLYYKKADFEASLQYLRRLAKANKDTKKFLRMMVNDSLEEYLDKMNPYGYQPFTIEELIYEHFEARYLFDSVDHFFDWAHRSLKKSSGLTKHSI